MTEPSRRELPPLPNLDRLKKEAKARLGEMRARAPSVRLADVQHVLAREHGFANWSALKAEVEKRAGSDTATLLRENRARGALHRAEVLHGARDTPEPHSPAHFLRLGLMAIVIFTPAALVGLALVVFGTADGQQRVLQILRELAGRLP